MSGIGAVEKTTAIVVLLRWPIVENWLGETGHTPAAPGTAISWHASRNYRIPLNPGAACRVATS